MPRAGRWLWEARRSGSDGSNDVQDLSTVGHVVVVGSPYHNAKNMVKEVEARTKEGQRWMAGFRQGMERTSELEKGRSSIIEGGAKYSITCLSCFVPVLIT